MKIAVIGATGVVGREMLKVLEEFSFPVTELIAVASEKSEGKSVAFGGKNITVVSLDECLRRRPDLTLMSAGGSFSRQNAKRFTELGCTVVDNSSAWRMDPDVPLVVPEINSDVIGNSLLIANPNCSTIQMVLALAPVHRKFGIRRIVVSTYQCVSGTGNAAVEQMENERAGKDGQRVYPHPIDKNCLPQCDAFEENGYTKEEMKMVNETRKILRDDSIAITATAVRVPVVTGHSESVNVELRKPATLDEIRSLIAGQEGVEVIDDPRNGRYPMPLYSTGKNEVFVGRLRMDESQPNTFNAWIVADNLRKGAATNAVQIAQKILERIRQTA